MYICLGMMTDIAETNQNTEGHLTINDPEKDLQNMPDRRLNTGQGQGRHHQQGQGHTHQAEDQGQGQEVPADPRMSRIQMQVKAKNFDQAVFLNSVLKVKILCLVFFSFNN